MASDNRIPLTSDTFQQTLSELQDGILSIRELVLDYHSENRINKEYFLSQFLELKTIDIMLNF